MNTNELSVYPLTAFVWLCYENQAIQHSTTFQLSTSHQSVIEFSPISPDSLIEASHPSQVADKFYCSTQIYLFPWKASFSFAQVQCSHSFYPDKRGVNEKPAVKWQWVTSLCHDIAINYWTTNKPANFCTMHQNAFVLYWQKLQSENG